MNDILHDIRQYSEMMTISQLMKFFAKKEVVITRAMIQNYIRDGLLPCPKNKRFYTHNHIAALVMIDKLKTVFDIPTIQKTLVPFMDEEGLPIETYDLLISNKNELISKWLISSKEVLENEDDGGLLLTMTYAVELKTAVLN